MNTANNNKRIVFMGTPIMALQYLEFLVKKNMNIVGVYCQPPRKKDRGLSIKKSAIQEYCENNKLDIFMPATFKNKKDIDNFKKLSPDLVVVMGYGNIIPKALLKESKMGFINIHVSLLPRWRGAAPIEYALLYGDENTGVTIFRLNSKLDQGPILGSRICKIEKDTSKKILEKKLNKIGIELFEDIFFNYIKGKIKPVEQNDQQATYAKKIKNIDCKIDFTKDSNEIFNKIRAFSPKPGAWINYNNERIKILSCKITKNKGKPSSILSNDFIIACKDLSIQPLTIQREGKKLMDIKDFILGYKFKIGDIIN